MSDQPEINKACSDITKALGYALEMQAVLKWASYNMWSIQGPSASSSGHWAAVVKDGICYTGDTLYEALYCAWSNRVKMVRDNNEIITLTQLIRDMVDSSGTHFRSDKFPGLWERIEKVIK